MLPVVSEFELTCQWSGRSRLGGLLGHPSPGASRPQSAPLVCAATRWRLSPACGRAWCQCPPALSERVDEARDENSRDSCHNGHHNGRRLVSRRWLSCWRGAGWRSDARARGRKLDLRSSSAKMPWHGWPGFRLPQGSGLLLRLPVSAPAGWSASTGWGMSEVACSGGPSFSAAGLALRAHGMPLSADLKRLLSTKGTPRLPRRRPRWLNEQAGNAYRQERGENDTPRQKCASGDARKRGGRQTHPPARSSFSSFLSAGHPHHWRTSWIPAPRPIPPSVASPARPYCFGIPEYRLRPTRCAHPHE